MLAAEGANILIVEDDAGVARLQQKRLERSGHSVTVVDTAEAARQVLRNVAVELMLLDYRLSNETTGLEFYEQLKAAGFDLPTILVTGFSNETLVIEALRAGVRDFVTKSPEYLDYLPEAVERLLNHLRVERRLAKAEAEAAQARAHRELAEARARLLRDLEQANHELDAFSYSISHDLRAPLRAIDGFTRIVLKDFAAQLPVEAQQYLSDVRDNARQMGQLIEDLLAFSRSSRQPLQKQVVDLAKLADQVVEELRNEDAGRKIKITIGELGACEADSKLLKQVLVNLVSNAIKYTRRREFAEIEIGRREQGPESSVYFVKDNGAGFDSRHAGRLFGAFQRLHRVEDFEGTGVGLAIVQRIINRHGGRVWAEAEVEKGATFFFTLA
ncbi:MAG TPA: ATP-binding protein [Planctomycetaceae bacterium]|nr:ATP-binding protein [Planctomycetaceae bacterium]